jgi:stage V sporulation protein D (sporulation-specific penicillin-binding protein)
LASFVAAAPIDDPRIVIYIMVDEPDTGVDYGSYTAAPYARMILEEALPYLSIMPDSEDAGGNTHQMPNLTGMSASEAKRKLDNLGLNYVVLGYSGDVAGQYPEHGEDIKSNHTALILLEQEDDQNEKFKVEIPDLTGMGPMEANEKLTEKGLLIKIKSVGSVAVGQFPLPGEEAYVGETVTVAFERPPEEDAQQEE